MLFACLRDGKQTSIKVCLTRVNSKVPLVLSKLYQSQDYKSNLSVNNKASSDSRLMNRLIVSQGSIGDARCAIGKKLFAANLVMSPLASQMTL